VQAKRIELAAVKRPLGLRRQITVAVGWFLKNLDEYDGCVSTPNGRLAALNLRAPVRMIANSN